MDWDNIERKWYEMAQRLQAASVQSAKDRVRRDGQRPAADAKQTPKAAPAERLEFVDVRRIAV